MKFFINTNKDFKNYFVKNSKDFCFFKCKINDLPNQGWKIHISSTFEKYQEVLKIVFEYCISNFLSFKFVNKEIQLKLMFGKTFDRIQSTKLITIYTLDTYSFKKIINDLYFWLQDYKSPTILSDKQFKNSCIFYRYGSFKNNYIIESEDRIISDERKPFFTLPSFVKDPFSNSDVVNSDHSITLNNKYVVKNSLYFSNFGGVYLANSIGCSKNKKIILKEFKPYFFINEKWTAIKSGLNEFKQMEELKNFNILPKPIEKFYENNYLFICKEYIEGIDLNILQIKNSLFFFSKENKELLNNSIIFFVSFFKFLLGFLNVLFKLKKVPLDLKLNNFIYDTKNNKFLFIDAESIHDWESFYSEKPYYINNNRILVNNRAKSFESFKKRASLLMVDLIWKTNSYLEFNKSLEKTFEKFKILSSYFGLPKVLISGIIDLYNNKKIDLSKLVYKLESFNILNFDKYQYKKSELIFDNDVSEVEAKRNFDGLKKYFTEINKMKKIDRNFIDFILHNNFDFTPNEIKKWIDLFLVEKINNYFAKKIIVFNKNKKIFGVSRNEIENKFLNILIKILEVKYGLSQLEVNKKSICGHIREVLDDFSFKQNDMYFFKNEKNKKTFYSPYLMSGTAGLILLIFEFTKLLKDNEKEEWYIVIEKLIPSILNFTLMKISFLEGIAGFVFVLIELSKEKRFQKYHNEINAMISMISISKFNKGKTIIYSDLYYVLKNDLNGKVGLLILFEKYLAYRKGV